MVPRHVYRLVTSDGPHERFSSDEQSAIDLARRTASAHERGTPRTRTGETWVGLDVRSEGPTPTWRRVYTARPGFYPTTE